MNVRLDVWVSRAVVIGFHAACLLAFFCGFSWTALTVAFLAYVIRGFGITGGYHRYFAHRSYRTSRIFHTLMGIIGCTAVQGGPLKWAREHRHHHKESDEPEDLHSPKQPNFWWAHVGWILSGKEMNVKTHVRDLEKYPELVWIERLQVLIIAAFAGGMYLLGEYLGAAWGTSGFQMLVWGFFISTCFTWNVTWAVNSVNHTWGSRRFETTDDSRNNWLIGILALGEGHHNNHHAHQYYVRQGLLWWEIDVTYYVLKALSWIGVTWSLNEPAPEVFLAAESLSRIRSRLSRKKLEETEISARIKAGQGILNEAILAMVRLRSSTQDAFRNQLISAKEMYQRLKKGAAEFAASVKRAEAVAYA